MIIRANNKATVADASCLRRRYLLDSYIIVFLGFLDGIFSVLNGPNVKVKICSVEGCGGTVSQSVPFDDDPNAK